METTRPATLIDPVCGMTVDVDRAEADGLLFEHIGRTYAFCRPGCRRAFEEDPHSYVSSDASAVAAASGAAESAETAGPLVIDEGLRRWYESCSCCLSDAYPEVKAQLDAERLAHAHEPAGPGICEVAEAG